MVALGISSILLLGGLAVIYWIHNQYQMDIVVRHATPPQPSPFVSICIPARNEELNIEKCLDFALAQEYPNFEVIAVDDRSSDSTAAIIRGISARNPRLIPISGSDLPEGWAGKPHALHQASTVARGQWLCFVDADTLLSTDSIASCLSMALDTGADLFSTMNRQVLGSFWEKVVMPLIMTALSVGFSPRKVNDPERRDAIANGQFILIKRSVYDAIGGHAAVREKIVEDKAISELVKWNGYRLVVADGSLVNSTRMYTTFPAMWEGWTKNIYLGLHEHPLMLLLGAFGASLALIAALFLPIWPVIGWIWLLNGGNGFAWIVILESLLLWGALIMERAGVANRMEISKWYALTTPLGSGVFAAMMLTSAWKVISGRGVTWRGRKYRP